MLEAVATLSPDDPTNVLYRRAAERMGETWDAFLVYQEALEEIEAGVTDTPEWLEDERQTAWFTHSRASIAGTEADRRSHRRAAQQAAMKTRLDHLRLDAVENAARVASLVGRFTDRESPPAHQLESTAPLTERGPPMPSGSSKEQGLSVHRGASEKDSASHRKMIVPTGLVKEVMR